MDSGPCCSSTSDKNRKPPGVEHGVKDRAWERKDEGRGGAQMALRPGSSLSCPCPNGHRPTGQQALLGVPHVPMGTSSLKDSVANSHLKEAALKFP